MARFHGPLWFAPTLAALSIGWAMTIGATPTLAQASGGGAPLASLAYLVGSVVCHQHPERSFHVAAVQLPVCARCTGLYVGGALGVIAWFIWRSVRPRPATALDPKRAGLAVLIASAPTAITVVTAFAGLWDPSNIGRATLAFPMGVAAGAVLAAFASNDLS
ncbi:MAG: DUF2085 domain-containing protein [Vicinamibacterales bacterium]